MIPSRLLTPGLLALALVFASPASAQPGGAEPPAEAEPAQPSELESAPAAAAESSPGSAPPSAPSSARPVEVPAAEPPPERASSPESAPAVEPSAASAQLSEAAPAAEPPRSAAEHAQPPSPRPSELLRQHIREAELVHLPDERLSTYRTPFEVLSERAIGRTSRRVRFDWRRGNVQLGARGVLPSELNNYDSLRAGGFVRVPTSGLLLEFAASYVWVWGSESTEKLALTPYRQPGRPDRIELDFGLHYPIAEGVVTALPGFFPAAELVLNASAQLRYLIYPGAYADLSWQDVLKSTVSGSLSDAELDNLEDDRMPGMELDPARYGLVVGLQNDVYLQSGFFLSYGVMGAVPLLSFMTDTELPFGIELDLSLGLAF